MEDDPDVASLYYHVLKDSGHTVTVARTAEHCLKVYSEKLYRARMKKNIFMDIQPYDAVILDYKMPDRNGVEVAKEIQSINPYQRIIFVSAFIEEWFDSIRGLKSPVEFLQKPVANKKLIDAIEQTEIFEQLERLNIDTEAFKQARFSPRVLKEIILIIKKSQIRKNMPVEINIAKHKINDTQNANPVLDLWKKTRESIERMRDHDI
jgi:DNA-binding response OmpR family regulator